MIFLVGSLGFFILVGVVFLLMIAAVEYERPGLATLSLIATFCALAYWGDFNLLVLVRTNPLGVVLTLVAYFAIGVAWGVGKWWFYVTDRRNKYDELRARYIEETLHLPSGSPIPENKKIAFHEYIVRNSGYRGDLTKPARPRDNKSRITTWMTYWPWSMVWTLISDPVKRIWKWSYVQLQGMFESISRRAYRGVEDDLPVKVDDSDRSTR